MKKITRPKTIPFEEVKARLLKNPATLKAYQDLQPEFQLACQMMDARIAKKMSQKELAKRAGTGQAVISRLEGMNAKPSFSRAKDCHCIENQSNLHFYRLISCWPLRHYQHLIVFTRQFFPYRLSDKWHKRVEQFQPSQQHMT